MMTSPNAKPRKIPVKSSNIKHIGFAQTAPDNAVGRLWVEFVRGGIYSYANVPARIYDNLLMADSTNGMSVGQLFIDMIKNNPTKYPPRKESDW